MKKILHNKPRRRRNVPPQAPFAEAELQRLCKKLEQQVPSLRTVLSEVKIVADWNDHEEEIARGIAQSIQDDLDHLQQERQDFCPTGTSFSEKIRAALQTGQPYLVTIHDKVDKTYHSQIVMATSRAAATEAVIKEAIDEIGYAPDEDGCFTLANVSTRDELRLLIRQMDDAEAAHYPPCRRRKTPDVDSELPDDPPLTARKDNAPVDDEPPHLPSAIAERLAKLPQRK